MQIKFTSFLFILFCHATLFAQITTTPLKTPVVISQIYGGAGCGTFGCSSYKNDYIELFNRSKAAVSLSGYSIQYGPAAGTVWAVTALPAVTLQPGQYFLIAEGAGANGINSIPTPDATGTIAMSATSAKVALVSNTTVLSGACPSSPTPSGGTILDFVGYGATANCYETAAAPAPSTITADFRSGSGTVDNNNNSADFQTGAPAPRNTASPFGPTVTLPVKLAFFEAVAKAKAVEVRWKTSFEEAIRSFTVERSSDGLSFTAVGTVAAVASGQNSYGYSDAAPLAGLSYYRLKTTDNNGSIAYSAVAPVQIGGRPVLHLYPNPVRNEVNVSLVADGKTLLQVVNAEGRIVQTVTIMQAGIKTINLDATHLSKGLYFVKAGTERVSFLKL